MKGKIIPLSFLHTQDSETGHQVIRMTPPHVICHRNYFYQKCFTRDGSKLIFGGAFEGHWNYYLLDIAGQQATRNYAKRQYTWLRHQPPQEWPRLAPKNVNIEDHFEILFFN